MKKIIIVNFIVMCMTVIFAARPVLAESKTAGDFTIEATDDKDVLTEGTDYSYADNVLRILSDTGIKISGTTTSDRIVVAKDISAKITLAGVNINSDCAFMIENDSTGEVTITLAAGTTNILKSGINHAGLEKNGLSGGQLTISGSGELRAYGGLNGAGIGGGGIRNDAANITITGGTVTAYGDTGGAGIGGGNLEGLGSNITITGGVVTAHGGTKGAGIGGGFDSGCLDIKILGGSVKAVAGSGASDIGYGANKSGFVAKSVTPTNDTENVYLLEIDNPQGKDITINGTAYPAKHSYYDFDSQSIVTENKIYAYIPAKTAYSPNVVTIGNKREIFFYNTERNSWICLTGILPTVTGIVDGETYCGAQTVTVSDDYGIASVTVNGRTVIPDEDNCFVLYPAYGTQTVVVENRIGNTAEVTVTIYDEDTYESMQAERYWNGNAGWQKINGKWYYFSDDGWVRTGWVCDTDGRWYYMNNDGSMATGWFKPVTSPRWYYLDPANGHMLTSCWIQDKDSNCWYYLNEAGVMCTGWLLSGNTWYLLDDNGAMCTGWNIVNGRWYYFN